MMATGSIAVALFLSSYGGVYAANYPLPKPKTYLQDLSFASKEMGEESVGVSAVDFREELGMDPTFSNDLIEQGFNPSQIQKIFTSATLKKDYDKMPLSE